MTVDLPEQRAESGPIATITPRENRKGQVIGYQAKVRRDGHGPPDLPRPQPGRQHHPGGPPRRYREEVIPAERGAV